MNKFYNNHIEEINYLIESENILEAFEKVNNAFETGHLTTRFNLSIIEKLWNKINKIVVLLYNDGNYVKSFHYQNLLEKLEKKFIKELREKDIININKKFNFLTTNHLSLFAITKIKIYNVNIKIDNDNIFHIKLVKELENYSNSIILYNESRIDDKIVKLITNRNKIDEPFNLDEICKRIINEIDYIDKRIINFEPETTFSKFYYQALEILLLKISFVKQNEKKIILLNEKLEKIAFQHYELKDFEKAAHFFEKFYMLKDEIEKIKLESYDYLANYHYKKYLYYFLSIIKINNPDFDLINNELYNYYSEKFAYQKVKKYQFIIYFGGSTYRSGKYIRKSINEVLNINKNYLFWYVINVDNCIIENSVLWNMREDHLSFLNSIAVNLIKLKVYDFIGFEEKYLNDGANWNYCENEKYTLRDSYYDGGGGDEWSDPSEFW